jgi:hypothetical protein
MRVCSVIVMISIAYLLNSTVVLKMRADLLYYIASLSGRSYRYRQFFLDI